MMDYNIVKRDCVGGLSQNDVTNAPSTSTSKLYAHGESENGQHSASKTAEVTPTYLKYASLIVLTLQNACVILVMRYARTRQGDMFVSSTAVVCSEVMKVAISLLMILREEGGRVELLLMHLRDNILRQPADCLKISVPAVVYVFQNNLLFVAVSNLDAATFQVTYQMKILTTALCMVLMLGKKLSRLQWLALVLLFSGVSIVQVKNMSAKPSGGDTSGQSPALGLIAVLTACLMSGFAGVYFEKMLKGTPQSLWLRNVQLGSLGAIFGFITSLFKDGATISEKGYFFGYDWVVILVILLQSMGGLVVAVVVKYADNILKGFASSAAIILSCVLSVYLFGFEVTPLFLLGSSLVVSSVYIYSSYPAPQPPQLPGPK